MVLQVPKPLNDVQVAFAALCEKGGGALGGPARAKVQLLLREAGQHINTKYAQPDIADALKLCAGANPWKVCYAMGLVWGHLANGAYIASAVEYLENGEAAALHAASLHHNERGPDAVRDSLIGGRGLFERVLLPAALPSTLEDIRRAQDRWLSPILSKDRPRYIGSWNASAMFMIALFAQPTLGDQLKDASIGLPPGGPIHASLATLYKGGILSQMPDSSVLEDDTFVPGSIFVNTGLMAELLRGLSDWDLLDVHSGLYILGTRDPNSASWYN